MQLSAAPVAPATAPDIHPALAKPLEVPTPTTAPSAPAVSESPVASQPSEVSVASPMPPASAAPVAVAAPVASQESDDFTQKMAEATKALDTAEKIAYASDVAPGITPAVAAERINDTLQQNAAELSQLTLPRSAAQAETSVAPAVAKPRQTNMRPAVIGQPVRSVDVSSAGDIAALKQQVKALQDRVSALEKAKEAAPAASVVRTWVINPVVRLYAYISQWL